MYPFIQILINCNFTFLPYYSSVSVYICTCKTAKVMMLDVKVHRRHVPKKNRCNLRLFFSVDKFH